MKSNKVTQTVAEMGRQSAIKNTSIFCRWFLHQPKVPAKLLALKK